MLLLCDSLWLCVVCDGMRRHRQEVWSMARAACIGLHRPASRGARHRGAVCSLSRALPLGMRRTMAHTPGSEEERRTCMRCCGSCAILRIWQIGTPLAEQSLRSPVPSCKIYPRIRQPAQTKVQAIRIKRSPMQSTRMEASRVHRQRAQTTCTDNVHRQRAQTTCTDNVHR